jgi:hypothetical protein
VAQYRRRDFEEVSRKAGIATITARFLSFGGGFTDFDNDGWVDLFIANGHVYQGVENSTVKGHYKQINLLFHNNRDGTFTDVDRGCAGPRERFFDAPPRAWRSLRRPVQRRPRGHCGGE